MARPNGVVIASARFWAFAAVDGRLVEGTMPRPPRLLGSLPLLRGLTRLALALAPVARRTGTARPIERAGLLGALLLSFGLVFVPHRIGLIGGGLLTLALLFLLFRGRTLSLHGAEHRAIAAAEKRRLGDTWDGSVRPSRFAPRCGTNFAALAAPVTLLADRFWPFSVAVWTPLAITVLSLALTMELWLAVQASAGRLARALLLPGLALQRLTTREPSLEETRVALRAAASVLEREAAS